MKIAIVSMQRIVNNGSYLQAYALRETLSKLSGASVGFLDFENGIHIKEEAKQKEQRLLNAMRDIKHTLLPKYRPYMKTAWRRDQNSPPCFLCGFMRSDNG